MDSAHEASTRLIKAMPNKRRSIVVVSEMVGQPDHELIHTVVAMEAAVVSEGLRKTDCCQGVFVFGEDRDGRCHKGSDPGQEIHADRDVAIGPRRVGRAQVTDDDCRSDAA